MICTFITKKGRKFRMEYLKKKTVFISLGVSLVVIVVCIFTLIFRPKKLTYTTLIANDGSFHVEFPTNLSYVTNSQENSAFIMDLSVEEEGLFFYATKISKIREIDFASVVQKDKETYLKDKENIHDDSGILPFSLENNPAYEYHFVYTDTSYGKEFYCNVLWVETKNNFYILNLEVVTENQEKFQDIFHHIKTSFVEL